MVPNKVQDGCYAWVVCGASFLLMVMQGVLLFCTGIFYIILKENLEAGDSEIALVTSLALGFNTMACKCYRNPYNLNILPFSYKLQPNQLSIAK